MSKQPGSHNTPRAVVEEILGLHIEEGYTYRQLAEKYHKPFKTIQNMMRKYCTAVNKETPSCKSHGRKGARISAAYQGPL